MLPWLKSLMGDLQVACAGFSETQLVRVEAIKDTPDDDETDAQYVYLTRALTGFSESLFVVDDCRLHYSLRNLRTYLLSPSTKPLLLDPWISSTDCPVCGRVEVFMPRELSVGKEGGDMSVFGILSDHQASLPAEMFWTKQHKSLADAVAVSPRA